MAKVDMKESGDDTKGSMILDLSHIETVSELADFMRFKMRILSIALSTDSGIARGRRPLVNPFSPP